LSSRVAGCPARFHPYSALAHTYSKSALAPGQRLGFLALAPDLLDAEAMRRALLTLSFGAAPDAVMQYALPDIDRLLIDVTAIERRRDRTVSALREHGYDLQVPERTFYLLPRVAAARPGDR
jgi:aspartate aminotransferase